METIKTPNFTSSISRIIADVRDRTCIDDVDADVIEKILQDALNEQCVMLDEYYREEYYNMGYDDVYSSAATPANKATQT